MTKLKILILEDNPFDLELIKSEITANLKFELEIETTMTKDEYILLLESFKPDIILSDYIMPQFDAMAALAIAIEHNPLIPFIVVTGTIAEEAAADSIKSGAWDYVVKERIHRLKRAILNSLKLKTERIKAHNAEKEVENLVKKTGIETKLLFDIFQNAPSSIIITDKKAKIISVNSTFEKITGYKQHEIVGKTPNFLKSGKHLNFFYDDLWQTISSGKNWNGEIYNKKKTGEIYCEKVSISSIKNENNEIIHYIAIKHDITEIKKQQNEIEKTKNWYTNIFENSAIAKIIIEANGTISLANHKFECLSKFKREEIENTKTWMEFVSPNDIEKMMQYHINRRIGKDAPNEYEFTFVDADGTEKIVLLNIGMMYGTDRSIASLQNITERKKHEEELKIAKIKAEENDKLKSIFVATMSHEVKTPLSAIMGFSELMLEENSIENLKKYAHIIKNSGKHLLDIIDSLMDLSLLQAGKVTLSEKSFYLKNFFDNILIYTKVESKNKNKENLSILFLPNKNFNEIIIKTDKQRITQVVTNLINNAIKYTEEGNIHIGYTLESKDITFFVEDTGIGIDADKESIIFEQFSQLNNSYNTVKQGVGLGLSICKEIAKMLNAHIWFHSIKNTGTTFYFKLFDVVGNE